MNTTPNTYAAIGATAEAVPAATLLLPAFKVDIGDAPSPGYSFYGRYVTVE